MWPESIVQPVAVAIAIAAGHHQVRADMTMVRVVSVAVVADLVHRLHRLRGQDLAEEPHIVQIQHPILWLTTEALNGQRADGLFMAEVARVQKHPSTWLVDL